MEKLYQDIGPTGGSKHRVIASISDILDEEKDGDDAIFFERATAGKGNTVFSKEHAGKVATVLEKLQSILFEEGSSDYPNKTIKTFKTDIVNLKKSRYCEALRLARSLIFRVLEILNPSNPLQILELVSAKDFLQDSRYASFISNEMIESMEEADSMQQKADRVDGLLHSKRMMNQSIRRDNRLKSDMPSPGKFSNYLLSNYFLIRFG